MGREAMCTVQVGGRAVSGKALLETKELLFRGDVRLRIPLEDVRSVKVVGDELMVRWREGEAAFALGAAEAARWKARMENPPSLLDKLGVKSGLRVTALGTFEPAFLKELRARAGAVSQGKPTGGEDIVFLAVESRRDLERLATLAKKIDPAGAIWLVRRKGPNAPVTEAESMAAGKSAGLVDTKVAAFSETHTAERYVIPAASRKR